jgi:hypothetical protein
MKASFVLAGLAVVGCGEVTNHLADAPPEIDAAVDAAVAPVNVTSLTLIGDGLPDTNVIVIFADDVGTLIADGAPDASGKISAVMPNGGTVTVLRTLVDNSTTLQGTMVSITGVKPGDDLTFGLHAIPNNTTGGGQNTMTVNFTPVPNAGAQTFSTKCGNTTDGSGQTALTFRDSCHDATFDLLMIASGGNLAQPVFAKLLGINFAAGGAFTLPAGVTTMQNQTINMTNVDTNIQSISASRFSMFDNASVGQLSASVAAPVAGNDTLAIPFPQGVGSRSNFHFQMTRSDAINIQNRDITTATLTNSQDVDVAQLEVPWITATDVTTTGQTWTELTPGTAPDGMMMTWAGHWTTAAKIATTLAWRVIRPVNASGAALVPVPAKYGRFDPAQAGVTILPTIATTTIVDYDTVNGYDEFRQQPETLTSGTNVSLVGAFVGQPVQRGTTTFSARLGVQ